MNKTRSSSAIGALSMLVVAASATLVAGCVAASDDGEQVIVDGEEVAEAAESMGVKPDPTQLCIGTSANSDAGTTATVTLTWIDDFETWRCSVKPTSSSQQYCCTPSYAGYSGATGYFGIYNPSGDGVLIGSAYAYTSGGGTGFSADLFTDATGKYCTGYDWGNLAYERCWVDQSGHGSCGHMKIGSNVTSLGLWEGHSFSCE